MSIEETYEIVDELLNQHQLIRDKSDESSIERSIELYVEIFNLLLVDSNNSENIFQNIKNSEQHSYVQRYVQTLKSLNESINSLDASYPIKEVLQERMLDNINLESIRKFEQVYLTDPQTACKSFIKENTPAQVINTVEVRTWGTEREYSNGLRNIIDQKVRSDDVGHAALVMRVAADDEGLRLVREYCMDDAGKTIIPYELKKIGNQVVYEVYWSYWPDTLHTMEQDYEHERRGLEYRDIKELDRNVPRELSDKYIVHKVRNGKVIPFASSSERVTVKSTSEITNSRSAFLDLKEKEIKLAEQIETIDIMLKNYLEDGKIYSPSSSFTDVKINKNSNFYEILQKYKSVLQPKNIPAKILLNKTISTLDAKKIKDGFEVLKRERTKELDKVKSHIEEVSSNVQVTYQEAQSLQLELASIATSNTSLGAKDKSLNEQAELRELLTFFEELSQGEPEYPLELPEHIATLLDKYASRMKSQSEDNDEEDAQYALDALENGQIDGPDELLKIIEEHKNFEIEMDKALEPLKSDKIKDIMSKNVSLYRNERENAQRIIGNKIDTIVKNMEQLKLQIDEIDSVIVNFPSGNPLNAIKEINQLGNDIKALDKIAKNFKGEQNFSYKLNDETITTTLKSSQETIDLKERISVIHQSVKQKLPQLRQQLKQAEIHLEHSRNSKGQPIVLQNLDQAHTIRNSAQKELNVLLNQQQALQKQLQFSKLSSTTHTSEIAKKQIRRGFPFKSSTLRGFNIEEMLKTAKSLAKTVENFNLRIANCSTTSMNLLNAGAPSFKKGLFIASKPPAVVNQYSLEIKSEVADANLEPNTIYIKQINGKIACSLIDVNGVRQEDIVLQNLNAPNPFNIKELEESRLRILNALGEQGFIPKLEYDGEAFLTNPQSVYAAGRVYERLDAGDKQAIRVAEKMLNPGSRNETYIKLINALSSKSNDEIRELQRSKLSIVSLIMQFILHPSAIVSLYNDYKKPVREKNTDLVGVESQLSDIETAIRNLNSDKKYLYINSGTPAVCISKMLDSLQASPESIPFFTNKKMEEVNEYILNITQKDNLTNEEKLTLRTYDKIIAERDKRISAVESALANGRNIKTQLANNATQCTILKTKFPFTNRDLIEHKVDLFINGYLKEKENQFLSIARPNFGNTLSELATAEEKLASITRHIEEVPTSISATVWKKYIETDPIINPPVVQPDNDSVTAHQLKEEQTILDEPKTVRSEIPLMGSNDTIKAGTPITSPELMRQQNALQTEGELVYNLKDISASMVGSRTASETFSKPEAGVAESETEYQSTQEQSANSVTDILPESLNSSAQISLNIYDKLSELLKSDDFIELGAKLKSQLYPNLVDLLTAIENNEDFSKIKEIALRGIEANIKFKDNNPSMDPKHSNNRLKVFHAIQEANTLTDALDTINKAFPKYSELKHSEANTKITVK